MAPAFRTELTRNAAAPGPVPTRPCPRHWPALARNQIKLDYSSISEIFVYDVANDINTKWV